MLLIVGLGNPGSSYGKNRHNMGFMAVDAVADRFSFSSFSSKKRALVSEGQIHGQKVLLAKPQTYMNLSGYSIGELAQFYKIPPQDIWVFHDDLDLKFLQVRVKKGGGHGGHNGLRSLEDHLGKEFWRIRLGIGRPDQAGDVSGFVLNDFPKSEQEKVTLLLEDISQHMDLLLGGQVPQFLSHLQESRKRLLPSLEIKI